MNAMTMESPIMLARSFGDGPLPGDPSTALEESVRAARRFLAGENPATGFTAEEVEGQIHRLKLVKRHGV